MRRIFDSDEHKRLCILHDEFHTIYPVANFVGHRYSLHRSCKAYEMQTMNRVLSIIKRSKKPYPT